MGSSHFPIKYIMTHLFTLAVNSYYYLLFINKHFLLLIFCKPHLPSCLLLMAQFHSLLLFLLPLFNLIALSLQQQSPHQNISPVDLAALAAIKASLTELPGTHFFSTWNFDAPDPCSSFAGITCSFSRVTILTLGTGLSTSRGLAGSLSPSLANLTQLTQLILFPGLVAGSIPPQLSQLTNLRVISFTNNRLTGPIPPSLSALQNLHTLDLNGNQLTGSIPPSLTALPELKVLVLASNELSGELTSVSAQLLHLDVKKNRVSGPLPRSLPLSLRYLSLSENTMWGPINVLESLTELIYLDLSMNQFNGPIPNSLLHPSLSTLLLQRNNFSGWVPRTVNTGSTISYGGGSIVDLSHNFLTGELSPVLAEVESLFLNNNRLIGKVPEEYVKSVLEGKTQTLYLQHNYLSGFPLDPGSELPGTAALCLSYNCMVPPVGLATCPKSAGRQLWRPASQCSVFNNHSIFNITQI
ncbi:receptor-like protein 12 [Carica papaya]|uniref:receptor-like protein 12 n=1 Tax=Carica papaya TaxID=3649 RepID=UPI000B8C76FA|nr:receptor-like protein 12 [Carica papaya]